VVLFCTPAEAILVSRSFVGAVFSLAHVGWPHFDFTRPDLFFGAKHEDLSNGQPSDHFNSFYPPVDPSFFPSSLYTLPCHWISQPFKTAL